MQVCMEGKSIAMKYNSNLYKYYVNDYSYDNSGYNEDISAEGIVFGICIFVMLIMIYILFC